MVNMSTSHHSTPRSTTTTTTTRSTTQHAPPTTTATVPIARSTIDDFREIVREQSFILPNNATADGERVEVPVKKYPPLPNIAVPHVGSSSHFNTFFRTETIVASTKASQPKKQMFYHFARTQRAHLPALTKAYVAPLVSDAMDLDENLPECYDRIPHRAETYTSPNDRMSSPIKRPSAPLPPSSAHIKRAGQHSFVYSEGGDQEDNDDDEANDLRFDDEDSEVFDPRYYDFHSQPRGTNRRCADMNERPNTLTVDDNATPIP